MECHLVAPRVRNVASLPRFRSVLGCEMCVRQQVARTEKRKQNVQFADKVSHQSKQQTAATPTLKEAVQSCKQRRRSLLFHRNSSITTPFRFRGQRMLKTRLEWPPFHPTCKEQNWRRRKARHSTISSRRSSHWQTIQWCLHTPHRRTGRSQRRSRPCHLRSQGRLGRCCRSCLTSPLLRYSIQSQTANTVQWRQEAGNARTQRFVFAVVQNGLG